MITLHCFPFFRQHGNVFLVFHIFVAGKPVTSVRRPFTCKYICQIVCELSDCLYCQSVQLFVSLLVCQVDYRSICHFELEVPVTFFKQFVNHFYFDQYVMLLKILTKTDPTKLETAVEIVTGHVVTTTQLFYRS